MVKRKETESAAKSTTPSSEEYLCRLCLKYDAAATDIFSEHLEAQDTGKESLTQRLFDLLNIKYEKSTSLPGKICVTCLHNVESFAKFRENVHKCESELQEHLDALKRRSLNAFDDEFRPGLNGNPGVFEPEEDCIITEINPEQEYESSEDDFSMEWDSDAEQENRESPPQPQLPRGIESAQIPSQAPSAENFQTLSAHNEMLSVEQHNMNAEEALNGDGTTADPNGKNTINYIAPDIFGVDVYAKNAFLCQYCDMAFTTQQDCTEHEQRHDISTPYVCAFCQMRTPSRQNLINHIRDTHDAERPYICALCNKGFCRRSDLKKHTIVHTGVRPFSCSVCAKSFSRNTNLTKHLRIHSSIKPHVCLRCPRSFSSDNELKRHARSHADLKPFRCGRCSASFTRKEKLIMHEEEHNRRESEFLQNQGLPAGATEGNQAMAVPLNPYNELESASFSGVIEGEDPYRHSILAAQLQQQRPPAAHKSSVPKTQQQRGFTCDICARQFTRERDLQRHKALHLDMLFTCKHCGTGFSRPEKLARHELENHAPQYPCIICRITFSKREALETHLRMHELQQTTQAALNAAQSAGLTVATIPGQPSLMGHQLPAAMAMPLQRPTAADMSFYSQMVPTMNLGFYSETRPEDRNDI